VVVVLLLLLLLLPANECQAARQQKLWKHCRCFAKSRRRGEAYPTGVKKTAERGMDPVSGLRTKMLSLHCHFLLSHSHMH
jgi:hypothetical protein